MNKQHFSASKSRRSFTSASSIGTSRGMRTSQAGANYAFVPTCREGNTSRSFHNFGGRYRISSCTDHLRRSNGGNLGRNSVVGQSILGSGLVFTPAACCQSGGIREIYVNESLLEPFSLEVDPHEHQVKAHEKEQMKDLNNQFACFIDKVRLLEQKNQALVTKWELLQTQRIPPVKKDLSPLCENYISSLKKKMDTVLWEKKKLENQQKSMQNLIKENQHKYEKELSWRTKAENDFLLLKQEADEVYKQHMELTLKKELLQQNIQFLKGFFAQERALLDCHPGDTSVVVNMDNSRHLDIDALIKNIESWYQNIAQKSKEEANLFYQNKMENLQNKQLQYRENLTKTNTEIAELNRLIQIMQCQLENEKKKVSALHLAIRNTEEKGDHVLKNAQAKEKELQNNLKKNKDKLASLLRDYHELMNTKLALDIEIAAYKTLLEGEENRIRTGMPVSLAMANSPRAVHNPAHKVEQ